MKKLEDTALSILDLVTYPEGGSIPEAMAFSRELARHAEGWGYKRFWVAEHHNMPGIASAATAVLIGHVASGTTTIRVGSGGIMLPNHAPLHHRRAVRHAGLALPRPHRPGPRAARPAPTTPPRARCAATGSATRISRRT